MITAMLTIDSTAVARSSRPPSSTSVMASMSEVSLEIIRPEV
jgi:hypothetical protein